MNNFSLSNEIKNLCNIDFNYEFLSNEQEVSWTHQRRNVTNLFRSVPKPVKSKSVLFASKIIGILKRYKYELTSQQEESLHDKLESIKNWEHLTSNNITLIANKIKSYRESTDLDNLPLEILSHIASYSTLKDIKALEKVNFSLYHSFQSMWKDLSSHVYKFTSSFETEDWRGVYQILNTKMKKGPYKFSLTIKHPKESSQRLRNGLIHYPYLWSVGDNKCVYKWNLEQGKLEKCLGASIKADFSYRPACIGEKLLVCDNKINIISTQTEKKIGELPLEDVNVLAFTTVDNMVIAALANRTVQIWDIEKNCLIHLLDCSDQQEWKAYRDYLDLALSPDRKFLIIQSTSLDNSYVEIWNLETKNLVKKVNVSFRYQILKQSHEKFVFYHNTLVLGDSIGKVRVFDLMTGDELKTLSTISEVNDIVLIDNQLITANNNGFVYVWQLSSQGITIDKKETLTFHDIQPSFNLTWNPLTKNLEVNSKANISTESHVVHRGSYYHKNLYNIRVFNGILICNTSTDIVFFDLKTQKQLGILNLNRYLYDIDLVNGQLVLFSIDETSIIDFLQNMKS